MPWKLKKMNFELVSCSSVVITLLFLYDIASSFDVVRLMLCVGLCSHAGFSLWCFAASYNPSAGVRWRGFDQLDSCSAGHLLGNKTTPA